MKFHAAIRTPKTKKLTAFSALIVLFVTGLGVAGAVPGFAGVSGLFGTTTQAVGALVTGTGDFSYDGQTVNASSFPNMGNGDSGKLQWVKSPLSSDCAPGSLAVSDKKVFAGGALNYTFTVGAGSDPAVPVGSVIVGVLIHSGNQFNILAAEWATDGSSASISLDKGYSNAAVFFCTPVQSATTETTGTDETGTTETQTTDTTETSTTQTTDSTRTVTVTLPAQTITQTTPGGVQTVTTPGQIVTVTTPGETVTAPGATVTTPGQTVTTPGQTVTTPGATVTTPGATVTTPGQTVTTPAKPTAGVLAAQATKHKRPAHKRLAHKRLAHTR